jgi:hypothetical protein
MFRIDGGICNWDLVTEHKGQISKQILLDSVEVQICERHLLHHMAIMALHHNGGNLMELIGNCKYNEKQCLDEVERLKLHLRK